MDDEFLLMPHIKMFVEKLVLSGIILDFKFSWFLPLLPFLQQLILYVSFYLLIFTFFVIMHVTLT